MQNRFDEETPKKVLKEALVETLQEQRELLHEVLLKYWKTLHSRKLSVRDDKLKR